jgi:hypothetical protein
MEVLSEHFKCFQAKLKKALATEDVNKVKQVVREFTHDPLTSLDELKYLNTIREKLIGHA